jgi:hypothetical protein
MIRLGVPLLHEKLVILDKQFQCMIPGKIKVQVMYDCCLAKFTQNQDLMDKFMGTGEEELIEDSPVDSFWGCGADGKGLNHLGKVLMRVRKDLRNG